MPQTYYASTRKSFVQEKFEVHKLCFRDQSPISIPDPVTVTWGFWNLTVT